MITLRLIGMITTSRSLTHINYNISSISGLD
jgi:hypothetical protein